MPVRMPVRKTLFSGTINNTTQAVRGVAAFTKGYGNLTLFVDNGAAQTCIVEVYGAHTASAPPTTITGLFQLEKDDGSGLTTYTTPASVKTMFPLRMSADYILLRAAQGTAATGTITFTIHGDAIGGGSNIGLA